MPGRDYVGSARRPRKRLVALEGCWVSRGCTRYGKVKRASASCVQRLPISPTLSLYRKNFVANFVGFDCKCVIFAFFEPHRLFFCFKERTICRAMHSSVREPRRDMVCASCRTSDPTTIRGLKHSYPYKTGLAVIVSVKTFRIYVNIRVQPHGGRVGCW